jgi:nitrous oxidase accessory protein
LLLAAVQVAQLLGVAEARRAAASAGDPSLAARPVRCRDVAGPDLQAALDGEPDAGALCLAPGVYQGPLTLRRGVALWGPPDAVVESRGGGTTVRLDDGAALLGLTVAGSGDRFDLLDAAVHVSGRGSRVEGVRVRGAAFGIVVERAAGAIVRGNEVIGQRAKPLGLRGDGIRLWETYDSLVEDNRVRDGRDVVLWYSSGNRLVRNRIEGGRYGAHLMYSHRNEIAGNRFAGNVTGLFVMYSRDVAIRGNVLADSHGAAGIGLGLKESGNLQIEQNLVVHNTIGFYVDASPLWPDDRNRFASNVLRLNGVAVSFLGRAEGNDFLGNTFRDSQVHVQVDGRGDAREATWRGNAFDDYVGYDLDGDGTGDVPHELRSLASDLISEAPALAFFRGTAALAVAEAIGRIVPLFEPRLVLVDSEPRMTGADLGGPLAD